MKTKIIHTCGHEKYYNMFGKNVDRERKERWLTDQLCNECSNQQKSEEIIEVFVGAKVGLTWVEKDTFAHREELKDAGYIWYPIGELWYRIGIEVPAGWIVCDPKKSKKLPQVARLLRELKIVVGEL